MKRALVFVSILAVVVACLALMSTSVTAKQRQQSRIMTKAMVVRERGTEDTHIKTPAGPNKVNARTPAPAGQGGPRRRGGTGRIHVDNHTPWYIEIFVDGNYTGTVGPWGDLYRYADPASYEMYGKANFDDGSERTWGPRTIEVPEGRTMTWELDE